MCLRTVFHPVRTTAFEYDQGATLELPVAKPEPEPMLSLSAERAVSAVPRLERVASPPPPEGVCFLVVLVSEARLHATASLAETNPYAVLWLETIDVNKTSDGWIKCEKLHTKQLSKTACLAFARTTAVAKNACTIVLSTSVPTVLCYPLARLV